MTVTSLASNYYNIYTNSAIRSSDHQNTYDVKKFSNALGVLQSAKSTNFSTLQNVDTFVKNGFAASALDDYDKLKTAIASSPISSLLSGSNGLSNMYHLLGTELSMITEQINELFSGGSSVTNAIQSYASYLDTATNGSFMDFTV